MDIWTFLLRHFVRLGEHDFKRTDDGIHQDILVSHAIKHEQHEPNLKFNDIGIIHLTHDIEFSGRNFKLSLKLKASEALKMV